ncbi:MAG: DUF2232 domain-containing protein [Ruminococcaceae bacterium]|nr:DUF2232 domain-containing protein [Oscillospiraceae bacterium]
MLTMLTSTIEFILAFFLGALTAFAPSFHGVCSFFTAVILLFVTCHRGLNRSCLVAVTSAIALFAATCVRSSVDVSMLLPFFLVLLDLILPGLVMGFCLRNGKNLYRTVAAGSMAKLTVAVLELTKLRFYDKLDIMETLVNTPIRNFFEIYRNALATVIPLTEEITDMLNDMSWYMQQTFAASMPAILILGSLLTAYLVFLVARKCLYHFSHIAYPAVNHFWELQFNKATAYVMIVIQLLATIVATGNISAALGNITLVLSVCYMVCGVSVFDWFFRRTGIWSVFRACIYVVGFIGLSIFGAILPLLNPTSLLMLVGLADCLFDFRHLRQKGATAL